MSYTVCEDPPVASTARHLRILRVCPFVFLWNLRIILIKFCNDLGDILIGTAVCKFSWEILSFLHLASSHSMMSLSIYLHFYFSLKDLCLLFAILICHTRSSVCDCQSYFPRIWYFCCCCEQVLYFHYVLSYSLCVCRDAVDVCAFSSYSATFRLGWFMRQPEARSSTSPPVAAKGRSAVR